MQPMYTNHQKYSNMVYINTSCKDLLRQASVSVDQQKVSLMKLLEQVSLQLSCYLLVVGILTFLNPLTEKICSDLSTDIVTDWLIISSDVIFLAVGGENM